LQRIGYLAGPSKHFDRKLAQLERLIRVRSNQRDLCHRRKRDRCRIRGDCHVGS
jgi:hypothetical protein